MSYEFPAFTIPRRSIEQPRHEVGMWEKMTPMFPKATASPPTPEFLDLLRLPAGVRPNPVPHVMHAAGHQGKVSRPYTVQRDLMHGNRIPTWDERAKGLQFFLFRDKDNPATGLGTYPAPTIRVPRGAIFHGETDGHGPPPHTIHWHGIEPTSVNDGVGHCSMEIGHYIYQWQPNQIGQYFYHCHRNTVQHFEFGLFGSLIVQPPDVFFASIASQSVDPVTREVTVLLNDIPIGAGRDGLRRTQVNLVTPVADFRGMFPGFVGGDPIQGVNVPDPSNEYPTDPHAFTVPYDVEVLWALDDRDSVWSDFAPDPFAFFPINGKRPGVDDQFKMGFFNDFRADYWFVTGVPVVPRDRRKRLGAVGTVTPAAAPPIGGIGGIATLDGLIPPALNSGVSGTQIAVDARVGQTILVRCLDAAYNSARVTFPVEVVIIACDGRSLGVPPFARYNHPFLLPAGTPFVLCTARRFEALIRPAAPVKDYVRVEFLNSAGATPDPVSRNALMGPVLQTALIPFVVSL